MSSQTGNWFQDQLKDFYVISVIPEAPLINKIFNSTSHPLNPYPHLPNPRFKDNPVVNIMIESIADTVTKTEK